jgi:hypothetical protein
MAEKRSPEREEGGVEGEQPAAKTQRLGLSLQASLSAPHFVLISISAGVVSEVIQSTALRRGDNGPSSPVGPFLFSFRRSI